MEVLSQNSQALEQEKVTRRNCQMTANLAQKNLRPEEFNNPWVLNAIGWKM